MELFFMSLTTGIMVGGIYALVALGWVLIYKCSGVLNLAMGELTLIGAYVTYSFLRGGRSLYSGRHFDASGGYCLRLFDGADFFG